MSSVVRRLPRAVVALLVLALALAGCAALPRSGPVTASDPDLPAPQGIGFFASGPQPGASPDEIVDGFLTASWAGYSDEFLVAREFLAGPAVATWQPLEQVRIYSDAPAPQYSRAGDGAVRLSVTAEASVDSMGRYTEAAPGTTIQADFTLARNGDGEWRIIELDDGVLLPVANFQSVYNRSALYFLTPDLSALVPEVRWFPQEDLASSLVRALLEGPSSWLAPGVRTMVPVGTRMTAESVQVAEGMAHVDLSADSLAAEAEERSLLYAQMERTLQHVPDVHEVEITAAQAPFEIEEPVPDLSAYPYVPSPMAVISDGELANVVGGDLVPRPGSEQLADLTPHDPAVGYDASAPTTVLLDGTDRLITAPSGDAQPLVLVEGTDLVAPSVDRHGWVWTTPARTDGRLRAVSPGGEAVDVDAPWLQNGTVRALRVSREGSRIVVVWEVAGAPVLDIAAVVRDADGAPRSLAEPVRFGERLTDAVDVAWIDESTVAVLGTTDAEPVLSVHLLPLGGPANRLPVVEGAVSLTAGRGDRSLVVATGDGRLYERNGAGWRAWLGPVSDPALPG
jgi:hypothetical protein